MRNRSFARIGTAYERLGDLTKAIEYYNRSLTEHRTGDVLTKLRAAEKAKIKAERDAYINPEEAEKARELGQKKFQDADYPGAVDAFTEMTKRAPDDPRGYSNRAAALIKLMAFPQAVQDCDEAIKRDPKFIRAYIRKGQALLAMKEYSKALDALTEAQEQDEKGQHTREIEQQQQKIMEAQIAARAGETEQETAERIQKDPEVSISPRHCFCRIKTNHHQLYADHVYPPGPCHAEYPAAGPERPCCPSGAHEERARAEQDSEAHRGWCHPVGTVKAG